ELREDRNSNPIDFGSLHLALLVAVLLIAGRLLFKRALVLLQPGLPFFLTLSSKLLFPLLLIDSSLSFHFHLLLQLVLILFGHVFKLRSQGFGITLDGYF